MYKADKLTKYLKTVHQHRKAVASNDSEDFIKLDVNPKKFYYVLVKIAKFKRNQRVFNKQNRPVNVLIGMFLIRRKLLM